MEKSSIVYCLWPTIDKRYTGKHLLNCWQHLWRMCYYDEIGVVQGIQSIYWVTQLTQLVSHYQLLYIQ